MRPMVYFFDSTDLRQSDDSLNGPALPLRKCSIKAHAIDT